MLRVKLRQGATREINCVKTTTALQNNSYISNVRTYAGCRVELQFPFPFCSSGQAAPSSNSFSLVVNPDWEWNSNDYGQSSEKSVSPSVTKSSIHLTPKSVGLPSIKCANNSNQHAYRGKTQPIRLRTTLAADTAEAANVNVSTR